MGLFLGSDLAAVFTTSRTGFVLVDGRPVRDLDELPDENVVRAGSARISSAGRAFRDLRFYVLRTHLAAPFLRDFIIEYGYPVLPDIHDDSFWSLPGWNEVIAYMNVSPRDNKVAFIQAMAVHPHWRRNSLNHKLLDLVQSYFPDHRINGAFTQSGGESFDKWRQKKGLLPLVRVPYEQGNTDFKVPESLSQGEAEHYFNLGVLQPAHVAYFRGKGWI